MKLKEKVAFLSRNKGLIEIINTFKDNKYKSLPYHKKHELLSKFNFLVSNELHTHLNLMINKEVSDDYYINDVQLNEDKNAIIVNGVDKNPYLILKKIILWNFIKKGIRQDKIVKVGDITYDESTLLSETFFTYGDDHIKSVDYSTMVMDGLLTRVNDDYKKNYRKSFDKMMTKEAREELLLCNKIALDLSKQDILTPLSNISKNVDQLKSNRNPDKKDLALLSIDSVIGELIDNVSDDEIRNFNYKYQLFMRAFFNEYAYDINIGIKNDTFLINNRHVSMGEFFIDALFQEIKRVEKNKGIVDELISIQEWESFKKQDPNFTKLDCYFLKKLRVLDENLKNRDLDLINYFGYENIFYRGKTEKIFSNDSYIFDPLTMDKDFLNLVDEYLTSNKDDNLYKIFDRLNAAYFDAKFNLEIDKGYVADTTLGEAVDETIYLNVRDVPKKDILITLFHEYRHLVQNCEYKNNHHIYNDIGLKYIKLNNYSTPFKDTYNYISIDEYNNPNLSYFQPIEYDAEMFAKNFIEKIAKKLPPRSKKILESNNCYNLMDDGEYFDLEKLSIISYKSFLDRNEILKYNKRDNDIYNELISMIEECHDLEGARTLLAKSRFGHLMLQDSINVFKTIGEGYVDVEYDSASKKVKVDNKVYSTKTMHYYELLEKIFVAKAIKKMKKHEIMTDEFADYISNEASLCKPKEYDEMNFMNGYYYHSCFDKYLNRKNDLTMHKNVKR